MNSLLDDVVRAFTGAKSAACKRKLSELAGLVVAPGADEADLRTQLRQCAVPCSAVEVNSGLAGRGVEELALPLERACTVLDRSSPWVPACPPAKPASYAEGFKPSGYEPGYLEMVFPHGRDSRLNFEAASHTYFVDRRVTTGSVTYLAGSASKPFDGEGAVLMMRASRSQAWPRIQYVLGAMYQPELKQLPNLDGLGMMIVQVKGSERRTRAAIVPQEKEQILKNSSAKENFNQMFQAWQSLPRPQVLLLEALLARAEETPGDSPIFGAENFELWTFERELEMEKILQMWHFNGQEKANMGTDAHYQIELWLNCDCCRDDELEVLHALQFIGTTLADLQAKAFRTEWRIFGEAEDLAGSIDFVARLPGGSLAIVDWKRSDKLRKSTRAFSYNERMAEPLDNLQDCKIAVYALQLNIYRWLLETYYGEHIELMILVSVHPQAPFVTAVPDLRLEVSYLMAERRWKHGAILRAEASAPLALLCAHSRQLMTDPVRLSDARYYQRACARRLLGRGREKTGSELLGNEELRRVASRLVEDQLKTTQGEVESEAVRVALAALLEKRRDWEDIMPEGGLRVADARIVFG